MEFCSWTNDIIFGGTVDGKGILDFQTEFLKFSRLSWMIGYKYTLSM